MLLEEKRLLQEFYVAAEQTHNFEQFVDLLLLASPGAIGRLFSRYKADSVLRLEDMPWALMETAGALGLSEDAAAQCVTVEKIPEPALSSVRQKDLVVESERELCSRYDYW
jgi:hypothetical protein